MSALDAALVVERAAAVRARLEAAGGDAAAITLVAVTKGFGPEVAVAAAAAGLDDLGENYAQEVLPKVAAVAEAGQAPRWHFLGNLQRNKVRHLAPHIALWQSVDRDALGAEIAKRAPGAAVLVQVNLSGEEHKGGCARDDAAPLVEALVARGLDVRGLMGVGPAGDPEAARPGFRWLRAEVERLGLTVCSMGMSADLEVAVQEGTTMVRVGTGLFGPRR
ncbi:MAG: YggS family pyridoxal phosphate-dependent enzyme [Acidimicrobiales bacterium]|nr:YggS family pyridoxal phosphate-dependent enzyme [Acidimicrobiales bacterium]